MPQALTILNQLRVLNIVVWPLSRGSLSRSRAIGGIIKAADAKDKLVKAYGKRSFGEVLGRENLKGIGN
jgi:hypothetical protein